MGTPSPARIRRPRAASRRTAAVAGIALVASLGVAGAAEAAVHQHGDAYGDTTSRALPARTGLTRPAPSAPDSSGDIVSLVAAHQYDTVDVLVEMAALEQAGDAVVVRARMRTPAGTWAARVRDRRVRGTWVTSTRFVRARAGVVPCDGLTATLDYDLDTATIRVPRACLGGDPAWVRVGATSRLRDGGTVRLDDAQRVGRPPRRTSLSPRIVS